MSVLRQYNRPALYRFPNYTAVIILYTYRRGNESPRCEKNGFCAATAVQSRLRINWKYDRYVVKDTAEECKSTSGYRVRRST